MVVEKKKMKIIAGSTNESNSAGFVRVENFNGIAADFSISLLKEFKETVEYAVKHKHKKMRIGIAKIEDSPILIFFLDDKDEFGYVIAGMGDEKEKEKEKKT